MNKKTDIYGAVVRLLKQNARLSVVDIAAQLGCRQKVVTDAIAYLEDHDIIVRYTAVVNEEKCAHTPNRVRALIELEIRPEKRDGFDKIAKRIFQHDNVIDHYLISGRYDFLIIVEADDLTDVAHFVSDQLAPLENIRSVTTHFILKRYKVKGAFMEPAPRIDRLSVSA